MLDDYFEQTQIFYLEEIEDLNMCFAQTPECLLWADTWIFASTVNQGICFGQIPRHLTWADI